MSGNKFTAEDVKHTIAYLGDPKVKIRFKRRYTWVKEVKILGPHKLQIIGKKPQATAKKLLAEAGHPNGFALQLDVYNPIREIAEAIAGDLRKVGIRATINPMPLSLYVKRRGRGEFTAFNGYYPTSAQPDVDNLLNFFFGANRSYYNDPIFLAARKKGATEFNLAKHTQIYVDALNQVNKNA